MKKKIAVGAVLITLLLVGGGLWYTRPVTIQQLRPELDLDACYAITAYSSTGFGIEMDSVTLGPDDPLFQPLLTELQGQTFSRSIDNILPFELPSFSLSDLLAGLLHLDEYMTYIRSPDPDLFEWELHLEFSECQDSRATPPDSRFLFAITTIPRNWRLITIPAAHGLYRPRTRQTGPSRYWSSSPRTQYYLLTS